MSVAPAVELRQGAAAFGSHVVWRDLDVTVAAGELLAVLGPNGSGKTTLVQVLLGLLPLSSGSCRVAGSTPRRGDDRVGYVPQQRRLDAAGLVTGRDFVGFGLDGGRFGPGGFGRRRRDRIDAALAQVDGRALGAVPIEQMSGGEQQRLRVAQALVGDPAVLLCDEPLLSLDPARQQLVVELLDARRREHGTAVVFVTHELNPVLHLTDTVLYLAGGRARVGGVAEVMTGPVLSELYGAPIEVVHVGGRILVVGADAGCDHADHAGWSA